MTHNHEENKPAYIIYVYEVQKKKVNDKRDDMIKEEE
jgi:hypothetical protein